MSGSNQFKIHISQSIGDVTAIVTRAQNSKAILTLAHGAGAGMNHPFMNMLATGLAAEGLSCFRFNFPFIEKGGKRPDPPAIATKTIEAAISKVIEMFPGDPVIVTGKSFGGRMSSQLLARNMYQEVKAMVFFGFPLHAPGKPSVDRAEHLKDIRVPMLFLQGSRDALADKQLMKQVCAALPKATLVMFEGVDHSFRETKSWKQEVLVSETVSWLQAMQR